MPRAKRPCPAVGCPRLTDGGRCAEHRQQYERQRGSRQQRGYTNDHTRRRAALALRVTAGEVSCWRCGQRIAPGEVWDLGHDDDRTRYRGPEHARCNRSAGGRAAHR